MVDTTNAALGSARHRGDAVASKKLRSRCAHAGFHAARSHRCRHRGTRRAGLFWSCSLLILGAPATGRAGASLLWSLDVSGTVSVPFDSPSRVQFILDVSPLEGIREDVFRLATPFLGTGPEETSLFNRSNSVDFDGFATLMTNGHEDDLRFFWLAENQNCPLPCLGQGGSIGEFDLSGSILEQVRLTVHELRFGADDPHAEDSYFQFAVTYDFEGTIMPEPATLPILLVGTGLVVVRQRRNVAAAGRSAN